MKFIKLVLIIFLLFFVSVNSFSQPVDSVVYQVNTIGVQELQLWIYPALRNDEVISLSTLDNVNFYGNAVKIKNADHNKTIGTGKIAKEIGAKYFVITFDLSENLIKDLIDGTIPYYVYTNKNINITVEERSDSTHIRNIFISPADLKNATLGKLKFAEEYWNQLLKASGNSSLLYSNFLDAGKEVDIVDSSVTNYVLQFNYHSRWFFNKYFSYSATGRFSTNKDDPLNKFSFYPVSGNYLSFNRTLPLEISFMLGVEGNQNFTKQSGSGIVSMQAIIPNLIDFTGGANRLRLKPILKLGLKGLLEYRNQNLEKENASQLFSEFYYYIPVYDVYSILIQGNAFKNFSGRNSGSKWLYQYNLTLGLEVPTVGFKLIAQYTQGSNDINYLYDSQLILGLMMDIFEGK